MIIDHDLIGSKCRLVPYCREHVQRYHKWMQDASIRELTASEPLSLREEYAMQHSWEQDSDKCTFIVCDTTSLAIQGAPQLFPQDSPAMDEIRAVNDNASAEPHHVCNLPVAESVRLMCGDVNLFMHERLRSQHGAEIEIMIAEPGSRRRGIATEALQMIMAFAREALSIRRFIAKISANNDGSRSLFAKLGFRQVEFVKVFDEYVFVYDVEMSSGGSDDDSDANQESSIPALSSNKADFAAWFDRVVGKWIKCDASLANFIPEEWPIEKRKQLAVEVLGEYMQSQRQYIAACSDAAGTLGSLHQQKLDSQAAMIRYLHRCVGVTVSIKSGKQHERKATKNKCVKRTK